MRILLRDICPCNSCPISPVLEVWFLLPLICDISPAPGVYICIFSIPCCFIPWPYLLSLPAHFIPCHYLLSGSYLPISFPDPIYCPYPPISFPAPVNNYLLSGPPRLQFPQTVNSTSARVRGITSSANHPNSLSVLLSAHGWTPQPPHLAARRAHADHFPRMKLS